MKKAVHKFESKERRNNIIIKGEHMVDTENLVIKDLIQEKMQVTMDPELVALVETKKIKSNSGTNEEHTAKVTIYESQKKISRN